MMQMVTSAPAAMGPGEIGAWAGLASWKGVPLSPLVLLFVNASTWQFLMMAGAFFFFLCSGPGPRQ